MAGLPKGLWDHTDRVLCWVSCLVKYHTVGRGRLLLALLFLLSFGGAKAYPFVHPFLPSQLRLVRLTNGNTLCGKVARLTEHEVTLLVPGAGEITFTRADVARVERLSNRRAADLLSEPPVTAKRLVPVAERAERDAHHETATRAYASGQYETAEREAQRALEVYLQRGGAEATMAGARRLIRQARQRQAEQTAKPLQQGRPTAAPPATQRSASSGKSSTQPQIGETATPLGQLATGIGQVDVKAKYTPIARTASSGVARSTATGTATQPKPLNAQQELAYRTRLGQILCDGPTACANTPSELSPQKREALRQLDVEYGARPSP